MPSSLLHSILYDIYFYLKNLEPVLDKEQLLLSQGRIDGALLQGITQQKEMMLASITSLNKRRLAIMSEHALQEPFSELNNFEITRLWTEITALSDAIAKQNMNNGFLLQHHINYASEAISILEAESGTPVYGPNGQALKKYQSNKKMEI